MLSGLVRAVWTNRLMAAGRALPTTEITPSAPMRISCRVRASSPLTTWNVSGLSEMMAAICSMLPDASLMPMILPGSSVARRRVVAASIFLPVRDGTL